MGTYNTSAEEIRESFEKWLKDNSEQGDISAEIIAEVWNEIAKESDWTDFLESRNQCNECFKLFNPKKNKFWDLCDKCAKKLREEP